MCLASQCPLRVPHTFEDRTEKHDRPGGVCVWGGILLNEIRVMDGCQLSLGFCKYRNSTKTEMCQTGGFGKNLN